MTDREITKISSLIKLEADSQKSAEKEREKVKPTEIEDNDVYEEPKTFHGRAKGWCCR